MGVNKVYVCDLCGQPRARGELSRLGVRGLDDRPEDADLVDVGGCCREKPISDVIAFAADARRAVTDG